jgi:hypothetical protein
MKITLLDGRTEDTANIYFDPATYHFSDTATGEDLTNQIRRADKQNNWPNFDPYVDNQRIYNETRQGGVGPLGDLPTSTAGIFADQILTDPLAAPLDALSAGVKQVFASSGVKTLVIVAIIAGGFVLLLKSSK